MRNRTAEVGKQRNWWGNMWSFQKMDSTAARVEHTGNTWPCATLHCLHQAYQAPELQGMNEGEAGRCKQVCEI